MYIHIIKKNVHMSKLINNKYNTLIKVRIKNFIDIVYKDYF